MNYAFTLVLVVLILVAMFTGHRELDDTDDSILNTRSGLEIITDYGTGCQYVVYKNSISVRYGTDKRPMCNNDHGI